MAVPSAPTTPTPADGATNVTASSPPAFTWTAPGATSSIVFFGVTAPNSDLIGGVGGSRVAMPAQGFASPPWPSGLYTRSGIGSLSGGTFTFDGEPGMAGVTGMTPLKDETTFYWQVFAI